MSSRQYYAHISQDGDRQTVMEHLRGTAEQASLCLTAVGLESSAYLAGLVHDLGKFTETFQDYLEAGDSSMRGSVIHTFQGCRYLLEQVSANSELDDFAQQYTAELLAYAVGAHHGLFDCVNDAGTVGMQYRREKENICYHEAVSAFCSLGITHKEIQNLFSLATKEIDRIVLRIEQIYDRDDEFSFEIGCLARLLLSAVIEGDRYDTAAFLNQMRESKCKGDMRPIWRSRLQFMEGKLTQLPVNNPIAAARTSLSNQCKAFAEQPQGIYRLNIPTGSGKTLSSLRYALAHAERYNLKRVILASPLLSILEQNAAVIHEYIGDDSIILEHHSNVVLSEQTSEQLDERELLIQNWNTPIIITSLVQLLNCMFDGKTSSIRRYQALCSSVIVIDEVQTVPTKLLSLFNLAIRFLAEQCGTTVILCSATQPYLEGICHSLFPAPKDIVPYDPMIWKVFARTRLHPLGNQRLEELPELIRSLMKDTDSLLVVCNKKDEAYSLLEQTKSKDYISYHLSASMCTQHRRDTVAALRNSLTRKEKTLCISTQVIEAGVDISFQCVLRLAAGMDSVVQAAGRCNRNGEAKNVCPVYIVTCTDERLGKLQDIQRGKTATISLIHAFHNSSASFHNDLASDIAIKYYYKAFYADMDCEAVDYPLPKLSTTVFDLLSENKKYVANASKKIEGCALRQAFKTAGQAFNVFDENTIDVLVPYGEGKQLISQMCGSKAATDISYCDSLLQQAASYTISLYEYQRQKLEEKGGLFQVCNGCAFALLPEYYDDQVGLKLDGTNYSFWEV